MRKLLTLALVLTLCAGMTMAGYAEHKYYLANNRLDVEAPDTGDDARLAPQPSADAPATAAPATNANANPGTGR